MLLVICLLAILSASAFTSFFPLHLLHMYYFKSTFKKDTQLAFLCKIMYIIRTRITDPSKWLFLATYEYCCEGNLSFCALDSLGCLTPGVWTESSHCPSLRVSKHIPKVQTFCLATPLWVLEPAVQPPNCLGATLTLQTPQYLNTPLSQNSIPKDVKLLVYSLVQIRRHIVVVKQSTQTQFYCTNFRLAWREKNINVKIAALKHFSMQAMGYS